LTDLRPSGAALATAPDAFDPSAAALSREVERLIAAARATLPALAAASSGLKDRFLRVLADQLRQQQPAVLQANARDVAAAVEAGRTAALVDRLRLDAGRVEALAKSVLEVAALADPVGQITRGDLRPNGLEVRRQRVPIGLMGMIYEARPGVTVEAAALAVKAGNAVILRGGSESQHSNDILAQLVREALVAVGLPQDAVQVPATYDRGLVDALVGRVGGLDLVIPRGGTALIDAVNRAARVPVIQHYQGICHVYVDDGADLDMAEPIVLNAKAQRPGVCNAMEAVLIDSAIAATAVPRLVAALQSAGVQVRGCPQTIALAGPSVVPAVQADYGCEFLDLICLCRVVDGLSGALDHIRQYGSRHTEVIVTRDLQRARDFVTGVDASCVLVNASTRFNDGGCLGLGAEIGISTNKLHAFGPMGLEALTVERFVVFGQGQVRS
jgi:glutamate-5-semialdehyde dehydrogenase